MMPTSTKARTLRFFAHVFALSAVLASNADAESVTPANVRMWANIRAQPALDSAILGRLWLGEELSLIERHELWYEVRFEERTGYISRTVARVTDSQPVRLETIPSVTLNPGATGSVTVDWENMPDGSVGGVPPIVLATAVSAFFALLSLIVVAYATFQTNVRSRYETFRVLRHRFDDLRKECQKAWEIRDFNDASKVFSWQKPKVENLSEAEKKIGASRVKTTVREMERYWINAFEEWYITTGGRGIPDEPATGPSWGLNRLTVFRPLWDDYYRDALTNTINQNPTLMVALWSALLKNHPALDKQFVIDMWKLLDAHHQNTVTNQVQMLNDWIGFDDPKRQPVEKPKYLQ
jgi:hypothetical protein